MSILEYPETAIILAAGQGTRLLHHTARKPKCMLTFEDNYLIGIQVRFFRAFSINNIVVVTGYKRELIEDFLGNTVKYIFNERYSETSSMYSLWLARDMAKEGCFIVNSDVLFHPEILKKLIYSRSPNALAMDFDAVLNEEEMKVVVDNGRVMALSKSFRDADGENVGLLKFDSEGMDMMLDAMNELFRSGGDRLMVPSAVDLVAKRLYIEAVSVDGLPWIEIDFPEDYERACRFVYPEIKDSCPEFF